MARLLSTAIDRTLWFVGAAAGVILAGKLPGNWTGHGFVAGALAMLALELWLVARRQQSVGKIIMGIRIVKADGTIAEPWRAAFLHTLLTKSLLGNVPGLSIIDQLWIFGNDSRCLHDLVSGTRVVSVKASASVPISTSVPEPRSESVADTGPRNQSLHCP